MSNVGVFPWSGFLGDRTQVQIEKEKIVVACRLFRSSLKREISYFHVIFVQGRQRNVQKSVTLV